GSRMNVIDAPKIKLTSFSHGGGCGCKIAPGLLTEILNNSARLPVPKELLVGIATSDDAAVYKLSADQALIATTYFFMPIVDEQRCESGRQARSRQALGRGHPCRRSEERQDRCRGLPRAHRQYHAAQHAGRIVVRTRGGPRADRRNRLRSPGAHAGIVPRRRS